MHVNFELVDPVLQGVRGFLAFQFVGNWELDGMGSVVISRHGVYVGASEAQYNLSPPGRQVRGTAATTQESANRIYLATFL